MKTILSRSTPPPHPGSVQHQPRNGMDGFALPTLQDSLHEISHYDDPSMTNGPICTFESTNQKKKTKVLKMNPAL